ncbi:hypothetical protein RB598_006423 [Gaeumannomyces tritici]
MADTTPADESSPLLPPSDAPSPEPTTASTMSALFWKVGAVSGASAVALGAFGAHGLKKHISDPQKLANWGTAAQYQLVHSGAVLLASGVGAGNPVAAGLFTAGTTMFSGSLYALVLDSDRFRFMGPVTPVGGLCLIAGWLALGFSRRGAFPPLRR